MIDKPKSVSGGGINKKKYRKTKKNSIYFIGGNKTILKGNSNLGLSIDGQTPSESKQFGLLPGNDWNSSLGRNGGIVAQMNAGRRNKSTKKRF